MSYLKKLLMPGLAALLVVSSYVINLAHQRTAQAGLYLSSQIPVNENLDSI